MMKVIDTLKGKTGSLIHTVGGLNRVGIDTFEKVSSTVLDSCLYYNSAGIRQLRAVSAVRDLSSLRGFFIDSVALGIDVTKHAIEDFQKSLALAAEMRIAVEDAFSTMTPPEPVAATRTKAITKSIPV
jgi:site-specific recombinase XerD